MTILIIAVMVIIIIIVFIIIYCHFMISSRFTFQHQLKVINSNTRERAPQNKYIFSHFTSQNSKSAISISSVASFLVWGGGGQDPQMYPPKIRSYIARASEASERLRNIYFQDTKYICIHTQSMQFRLITYDMEL